MLPVAAQAQSGLITKATELEPITLASGKPLAAAPYELEAGKYYRIDINADGSAELAIGGAEFFRNVWVNEIVINDIEVRPLGVDSIEFDDEGTRHDQLHHDPAGHLHAAHSGHDGGDPGSHVQCEVKPGFGAR